MSRSTLTPDAMKRRVQKAAPAERVAIVRECIRTIAADESYSKSDLVEMVDLLVTVQGQAPISMKQTVVNINVGDLAKTGATLASLATRFGGGDIPR